MGQLHSQYNFENQSVGGVVLGAPMLASFLDAVVYHWDDHRIPSGEILPDATIAPAIDTPSVAFGTDDTVAVLDQVSALPEAPALGVVLEEIAAAEADVLPLQDEVTPETGV